MAAIYGSLVAGADIDGAMQVLDEAGAARRIENAGRIIEAWDAHPEPLKSCQWALQLDGNQNRDASLKEWAHDGENGGHLGAFSAAQVLIRDAGARGFWGHPGIAGSIWRDVELAGSDGSAARPTRLALYPLTERAPRVGPGGPMGTQLVGFRVVLVTNF